MEIKSVLRLLKTTKRIALWSAVLTGLAVTGLAQTTPAQEKPAPAAAQTAQTSAATAPVAPPGYKVEETRLGEFRWRSTTSFPIGTPDAISVSADGRHVASYMNRGDCRSVGTIVCFFVDGKPYPIEYGYINGLALSFDGKHVAYSSHRDKRGRVVLDGRKVAECDDCMFDDDIDGHGDMNFSPDGKHLTYVTKKIGIKYALRRVVVDTESGQEDFGQGNFLSPQAGVSSSAFQNCLRFEYDMDWETFSPDRKHVACTHRQGKKFSVVVDGQEGAAYDDLLSRALQFQFDQVLYNKYTDKRWVFEAEVNQPCSLRSLCFSQDSMHFAYAAKKGGMWVIVLDGKEVGEYSELGPGSPSFSPDGKHIAVTTRLGGSRSPWQVVIDGHAGPMFASVLNPGFSPDSKQIAYIAAKERSIKYSLVVDDRPGPEYYEIGDWKFSPDAKHLAYIAATHNGFLGPYGGGQWSVILDGQAGPEYSIILPHTLVFDPNGTLEFLAVREEGHAKGILGDPHGSLFRVKYIPTP
jgi:hypothetical protein